MVDDDDMTTDTGTVKTMAIMTADGTCAKHPTVKIREVHADGTIYQRESCPECDKEYSQNKQLLEQRKEELNRQMRELEDAQKASEKKAAVVPGPTNGGGGAPVNGVPLQGGYPPYGAYPGAGPPPAYAGYPPHVGVDPTVQRMQELQESMLRQKEDECKFLRQKVDEQSMKLQEASVEIALLKEKLIQQEKLFEQDKKIVQLQAEANARKEAQAEAKEYIKAQTEFLVKAASAASAASSVAGASIAASVAPSKASNQKPPAAAEKFDHSAADSMWNSDVMLDASKNMGSNEKKPSAVASSSSKSASSNGSIPQEFSTETPGTVPLTEDITYGTNVASQPAAASAPPPAPAPAPVAPPPAAAASAKASASDVFQPKYVAEDEKNKEAAAAAGGMSNAGGVGIGPEQPPELLTDEGSLGNTVASSTYGEDRQKVVKQPLLDPYGDKGIYTGVVLRSTGMPHGLGRMVYEEDGRIYEGDWYVRSLNLENSSCFAFAVINIFSRNQQQQAPWSLAWIRTSQLFQWRFLRGRIQVRSTPWARSLQMA